MSLTSVYFIILLVVLIPVYYLVPKKCQWFVLLAASMIFYCVGGGLNVLYVIFTALSTFIATSYIQKVYTKQKEYIKANKETLSKEDKKALKAKNKKTSRRAMLFSVFLNVGLLLFFKLYSPIVDVINGIFSSSRGLTVIDTLSVIMPLGISYYTLQTVGYTVDVYLGTCEAERNFGKVLLFTSFFPQITQGPISDFKQLSGELFSEHPFEYKNYAYGFQRMLWGFFKKLVISNVFYPYILELFDNYNSYSGITALLGAFMCMIQLYADFSGYMDIVCGISEMLGIKLAENFNCPFFSKSLAEFWRRWHITLGAWFKKYVFYPITIAKWNNKFAKKVQSRLGNTAGMKMPSTIALLAIWFSIGLWHGASLPFITWGLLNGLIMIFSLWMEPVYKKCKTALHIKEESKVYSVFQMVRTFVLVSFLEVISDIGSLKAGMEYLIHCFSDFSVPKSFSSVFPGISSTESLLVAIVGLLALLILSILKQNEAIRDRLFKLPFIIRFSLTVFLFFVTAIIGLPLLVNSTGGFQYAQF